MKLITVDRHEEMFNKIKILKSKGYFPDNILDIGACLGTWTEDALKIYPDAHYFLFEAINYNALHLFDIDTRITGFYGTLLSDKNQEVDWYELCNTGDSVFKELTHHYENCKPQKREAKTLDSIALENEKLLNSKNILMKLDCQGSEINILKGATLILHNVDFI